MRLNTVGLSLRRKRHVLPASLVVTQSSPDGIRRLVSRNLTFRSSKKRR